MLKRIAELTNGELVALTDEDITNIIDLECAHRGIPLLPADPGPKPEVAYPPCDLTMYSVAGFLVQSIGEAESIMIALTNAFHSDYTSDYNIRFAKPLDGYQKHIETVQIYSKAQHEVAMRIKKDTADVVVRWEAESGLYKEIFQRREEIADELYRARKRAINDFERRQQIRRDFARYLKLADGNIQIALRFLEDADSSVREQYADLIEEFTTTAG